MFVPQLADGRQTITDAEHAVPELPLECLGELQILGAAVWRLGHGFGLHAITLGGSPR
jgi:hypothetical protein